MALYRRCSGNQQLFLGLNHSAFRGLLKIGSARAGLPFIVLPHGLRHGGPSHDALHGHYTLRRIQQRGRWASWDTVRRYEKHGRLLKISGKLNPTQLGNAETLEHSLGKQFITPIKNLPRSPS